MRAAAYDTERDSTNTNSGKTIKKLATYLWPKNRLDLKMRLVMALLLLVLAKVINIYVPFLLKLTIDQFTITNGLQTLPIYLIVSYGLARLGVGIFGELRDLVFVKVVQHAQRTVSLLTFKHLHNLSLDFHLSRQTGGLSRVIERGTRGVSFVLRFLTFNIIPTFFELTLITGILVYNFDYSYALIILVTIASYITVTLSVTEWRLTFRKTMNAKESKANTSAIDSLINFETVKYFGNEEHEYSRFDRSLAGYEKAAIRSQYSLSLLNIVQTVIICTGLVVIMLKAGQGVVNKTMTVGDFVLVNTYMIQLYLPLNFLGFVYREVKNSLVDMEKMFELTEISSEVGDKSQAKDFSPSATNIEFVDVHFGYNKNRTILKGISFKVPSGGNIAIVGPSGAGKSTIARLLFRFYDVNSGSISIGGQNIQEVKQKSLRALIGVVPQDTVLFNDSIGYNIGYGLPGSSQSDIEHVARLAQIHEFIKKLPEGYATPVGERGLKLSGGEKQRVAIARALLKKPKVLLFDEATSSLDTKTEQEILGAFKEISKGYTTLTIAHRLSTIVDADQIIVVEDGKITELGTHNTLISNAGLYKSMWDNQSKKFSESS